MRDQARGSKLRGFGRWYRPGICLLVLIVVAASQAGCTRAFFRKRADEEVETVLTEKNKYPDWTIENWYAYPDSRARFGDPTNPDRPPMPPDDPAASNTAPHPQRPGHAGVGRVEGTGYLALLAKWDQENRAAETARGEKAEITRTDIYASEGEANASKTLEPGIKHPRPYVITMEQATELGMINSREFQDARENLYLTALPVTLERFGFAAQLFGIEQATRQASGSGTPEGRTNEWAFNTTAGFAKLFSTGALMLFSVANQTVINFAGVGRKTVSDTTMTLDLMQPLLRGGGRAVALEPLTQAERNLLYQIRTYARFRKEFFVSIAGGGGGSLTGATFVPTNVLAPAAVNPTAGLGASGLIPGIISATGRANPTGLSVIGNGAGVLTFPSSIPQVSGYIGALNQYAQINIDKDNIARLQYFLKLYEATREGGDVSQLQVDLVKQQLLASLSMLYTDQQQWYLAIDTFKFQLGLPIDIFLELDTDGLRPMIEQFARYELIFKQFTAVSKEAHTFGDENAAAQLRGALRKLLDSADLVKGTRFRTIFPSRWAEWEKRSDDAIKKKLQELAAERNKLLDEKADLEKPERKPSNADRKRLREINARVRVIGFDIDLGVFEQYLRRYESKPWAATANLERRKEQQQRFYRTVIDALLLVLVETRNERFDILHRTWPDVPAVRLDSKNLLTVDLDEAEALVDQAALTNRLDLMNIRAQLVDAWRQIKVFANALLGTFNVEYQMQTNSPLLQAQPLNIGGSRTTHQLILNGELPLVRLPERNNYRAALINFQRERRTLMEAEDLAMFAVRNELRQLRQLAEQYKIQLRQVELAYLTVENSLDTFLAPPAINPAGVTTDTATRAAALTQQLLSAQSALPRAQTALLTVWVSYITERYQLYRDMELMPLDNRGVWIDVDATSNRSTAPGDGATPERIAHPDAEWRTVQRPGQPREIPLRPEPTVEHAN